MTPSMTRATKALELQSNTPSYATTGPLNQQGRAYSVMNGRPIHQTLRSTSLFRRRGRNGGIVAQWTRRTIEENKSISILLAIQCWYVLYDRSSTRAITNPNTTIKHKTVGSGSRSVQDRSTLGRLDGWGKLLVEALEGRRRFQCRAAQSLLAELLR
jgi:hypothetical protein